MSNLCANAIIDTAGGNTATISALVDGVEMSIPAVNKLLW